MYVRHFVAFRDIMSFFCITVGLLPAMSSAKIPMVINTWAFTGGTAKAWDALYYKGKTALDAVEIGCSECEIEQCDFTVGYGGSPDETGETTLDAMIMDGPTHDVGAVGALRRVKSAISVARKVLEHTNHTLLVGDQATKFAIDMGFKEENLSTPYSIKRWEDWKKNKCQPSFWKNVTPNPRTSCGPFKPIGVKHEDAEHSHTNVFDSKNHDTIGMIAIEKNGNLACGTSTNGAIFKIPGRVGDSPIPGAGAYVEQEVGAAAATGDGDIMMRFLPSYQTVENMRQGMDPTKAAEDAVLRMVHKHSMFSGAVIAATSNGDFGAACHGMKNFPFSVVNEFYGNVTVKTVTCMNS